MSKHRPTDDDQHRNTDTARKHLLAGNLVTEAIAASEARGVAVTADEREIGRKIHYRLSEMLMSAGHSVNPNALHHMIRLTKKPQGAVEIGLRYEGMVGCSDDRATIAVKHLLKGASIALGIHVKDHGVLEFRNLADLIEVVDAITVEAEKKIGQLSSQRCR